MSTLEKEELRVPCKAGTGEMLSKDREALSSVLADASIARQISDMIRAYGSARSLAQSLSSGFPITRQRCADRR